MYKRQFERFEKLNEYSQGTGLGLAISRLIVEMCIRDRQGGTYTVTAMKETIERSNSGWVKVGDKVRCV